MVRSKVKWIEYINVSWALITLSLFVVAGLRAETINQMISNIIPNWDLYSHTFWLVVLGLGITWMVIVIILNLLKKY